MVKNLAYLVALHSIDGLGPVRLKRVMEYYKDPKLAWEANPQEFRNLGIYQKTIDLLIETKKKLDPEKEFELLGVQGIKVITIFDQDYPERLSQIYDPPVVLYYKGEIPNTKNAVAIVGTRKITGYGRMVTEKFAKSLAEAGLVVVSDLATGVDTVAHRSTVEAGGQTIAVLGGGIKKIFPADNTNLAKEIENGHGAVISEFPPDYPHLVGNFPARNRIIAGLVSAVLVTEAAEDSGSLIIARVALEGYRDVYAIPGPITSDVSMGTAKLLQDGAKLVTSPEEIIQDFKGLVSKVAQATMENLETEEKIIVESLTRESKHIDELCREFKKSSAEISAVLIKMEIKGVVKNIGAGVYAKAV
jgi:DNA processing protein